MSERRIKILGILLVFLLNLSSGWVFEAAGSLQVALRIVALLFFMILQWEAAHQIIRYGRRKFPELGMTAKRVRFTAVYFLLLSIVLQALNDVVINNGIDGAPFMIEPLRIVSLVLTGLLFALTTIGMFEAVYYYNNFSRAEAEKQELLRANLQSQLDSLKGQVNPHFLFNCLNSLSALVTKDAAKAESFVEEMANVYRYLLRSNQQQLTTLKEELNFADSYLHLLSTRFADNLKVTTTIAAEHHDFLLPPLTMQLLIENTVKHNIVSSTRPLHVQLFTSPDHCLFVVNTLQKKQQALPSNGTGLSNIIAKYQLLKQRPIEIIETTDEFIVSIPLIKPQFHDAIYY